MSAAQPDPGPEPGIQPEAQTGAAQTASPPKPAARRPAGLSAIPGWLRSRLQADVQNPVVIKEMRSAMRGVRPTVMLSIYLTIMGGVVGLVYLGFASSNDVTSSADIRQVLGKAIFFTVVGLEMLMVCLLAPALSAGAISAERERQTYDLLRTTLLSARSLVTGKLNSSILFLLMMLVVGFPLQSIAYFLGGVSIEEVLISFLMLGISTVIFCVIGIIISSIMNTTLAATVVSYIVTISVLFGAPMLLLMVVFLGNTVPSNLYSLNNVQEVILQTITFTAGYILIAINPLSAAIASEIMLVEEQQLYFTTLDLSYGWKFPVVAPWISYTIFAIIVSLLLIRLAVAVIQRVEK